MAGGLRKEGHGRPRRAEDTAASDSEVAHVVLLVVVAHLLEPRHLRLLAVAQSFVPLHKRSVLMDP